MVEAIGTPLRVKPIISLAPLRVSANSVIVTIHSCESSFSAVTVYVNGVVKSCAPIGVISAPPDIPISGVFVVNEVPNGTSNATV